MNDIIYVGKHATTYKVDKHYHTSWELIYCTGGEGDFIYDDKVCHYDADSVVIIPPMIVHYNESDVGFTNIHINIQDLNLNLTEPLILQIAQDYFLQQAFDASFYFYSNGGLGQSTILPVYGQLIAVMIRAKMADDPRSELVKAIADNIVSNYPDPDFDLNACLQSFSFSTEYLKKLFKKEIGMTPAQYLTNRRLENAARSLAVMGSSKNITAAARQSGFNDPLYFSKLFKKRYGVSPKFYDPSGVEPPVSDPDATKIIPGGNGKQE